MTEGPPPYRGHRPRPLAPYAPAWREYAWRTRSALLLLAAWILLLVYLALRLRTWFLLVVFPAPFKAWCLSGFRCPRCERRFCVSESSGWWQAARVRACLHCGLPKGSPSDPDDPAL